MVPSYYDIIAKFVKNFIVFCFNVAIFWTNYDLLSLCRLSSVNLTVQQKTWLILDSLQNKLADLTNLLLFIQYRKFTAEHRKPNER
jgi:hypothetical protein